MPGLILSFKSSSTLAENKLGIVSEYTGPPSNTGMTDLKSGVTEAQTLIRDRLGFVL